MCKYIYCSIRLNNSKLSVDLRLSQQMPLYGTILNIFRLNKYISLVGGIVIETDNCLYTLWHTYIKLYVMRKADESYGRH